VRVGRTLPPAAAPLEIRDFLSGLRGILAGRSELQRFESELREHFGVKHCFLVSSGKAAFTLILLALRQLNPGRDQVLVPAFTCYSVPSSIVRAGLRVRLCDMHPERLDFDLAKLRDSLSDEILAVVPTHLFGIPADVAGVQQLARGPGVAVVEDAAQAMGEAGGAAPAGTLGDAGFFSLGRGKALSVVEGGVILTDRDDLANVLDGLVARLPRYGLLQLLALILKAAALMVLVRPALFWLPRGMPFLRLGETLFEPHFPMLRMSAFQAGLARGWRAKLASLRNTRRRMTDCWMAALDAAGLRASDAFQGRRPALLRFPLRISDDDWRARLLSESASKGLGVMRAYPTSIDAIPALQGKLAGVACPVAERYARELVTLPTHEYVTDGDVCTLGGLLAYVVSKGSPTPPKAGPALAEQR
jgi:dTDP-4-amino-4,6-dideoxygalactose transaminase